MSLSHRCFSQILQVKPTTWFFHKLYIGLKWVKSKCICVIMYAKDIPFYLNILRHDILHMFGYTIIHVLRYVYVHKFKPHWLVSGLHLHRTTFSKFSGATCMSVLIAISSCSASIHPQSFTFNSKSLLSSTFHEIICWCASKPWKYANRFVVGILSSSKIPLRHMSRFFMCL